MALEDEKIDDVIENASLIDNIQLKFLDDYIINNKYKIPTKLIS